MGGTPPSVETSAETARRDARGAAPWNRPMAATAGVAETAPTVPHTQVRAKTKGVADLVFLVDVSGSMATCIDALRRNIEAFVDSLSRGDANNAAPVRDWRGKVVGYRDIEAADAEGLPWIVDNPFVRDVGTLKGQLGSLQAAGGGDEPESLLDALYKIASMEAMPKGSQGEDDAKWRYRFVSAGVAIASRTPRSGDDEPAEAKGARCGRANMVMANRIILSSSRQTSRATTAQPIDKSEWEVVEFEGLTRRRRAEVTSDPVNFRTTLKQRSASVSPRRDRGALGPSARARHGQEAEGRRHPARLSHHQGVRARHDGYLVRGTVGNRRESLLQAVQVAGAERRLVRGLRRLSEGVVRSRSQQRGGCSRGAPARRLRGALGRPLLLPNVRVRRERRRPAADLDSEREQHRGPRSHRCATRRCGRAM